MDRIVPLLLLLLTLNPAEGDPGHAQDCADYDVVLKEGEVRVIKTVQVINRGNGYLLPTTVFVKPDPGFEGISVNVTGASQYGAWFPMDDRCLYPVDGGWWEIVVDTLVNADHSPLYLYFRLWTSVCSKACMKIISDYPQSLTVVGHGPSTWRQSRPQNKCALIKATRSHASSALLCTEPPPLITVQTPATPTTPAMPTTTATLSVTAKHSPSTSLPTSVVIMEVVAVVLMMGIVAMVAVVVVRRSVGCIEEHQSSQVSVWCLNILGVFVKLVVSCFRLFIRFLYFSFSSCFLPSSL